jgi:hypothetical protein
MDANCIGPGWYIIHAYRTRKHTVGGYIYRDRSVLLLAESRFLQRISRFRHLLIRHLLGSRCAASG